MCIIVPLIVALGLYRIGSIDPIGTARGDLLSVLLLHSYTQYFRTGSRFGYKYHTSLYFTLDDISHVDIIDSLHYSIDLKVFCFY